MPAKRVFEVKVKNGWGHPYQFLTVETKATDDIALDFEVARHLLARRGLDVIGRGISGVVFVRHSNKEESMNGFVEPANITKFRVAERQKGRIVDGFILSFPVPPRATRREITTLLEEKLSGRGLRLISADEQGDGTWQVDASHMPPAERD